VWPALVDSCNKAGLHLVIDPSGVGPSDHTSFYLEGIPVLHFFTGQHAQYHKPTDTADLLNYEGMLAITDYAQCLVAGLDAIEEVPYTATADSTKDETPAFKVTLGVMPDYMYTAVGMRIDGVNPGRPAEKAGMHRGDIVVKMDTLEVVDMMSYMQGLALFEPGQTVILEFIRSDERMSTEVIWD
jgi:C-terminal processing protease CtpA/Prc